MVWRGDLERDQAASVLNRVLSAPVLAWEVCFVCRLGDHS
jgi:hypothetical protein